MMKQKYTQANKADIDRWIHQYGLKWAVPVSHEEYIAAKCGRWNIRLTPVKPIPHKWLEEISGKKVLGLASGGGQQMPILAAMGAQCTVLDISEAQLESERQVAEREGYSIEILAGDMTERLPFADETFDIIINPVSNHYIEKAEPVFQECFRVLKHGGELLCGLDTGIYWAFDFQDESTLRHKLPFNPLENPEQMAYCREQDMGIQFSHTLAEQIGGQLHAGFTLLDIYEDTNGDGPMHEYNVPTFIATRAVRGSGK